METTQIAVVEENQDVGHTLYERLQHAKKMVGGGIFAIGGILSRFKREELWKGYADSWREFCASEAHSYSFAQTAIRIYEKYIVELALPEDTIDDLSGRDYTALDKACKIVTKKNKDEWIGKLITLARQDIVKEVSEAQGQETIDISAIDRLVAAFRKLDYEERGEFLKKISEIT